MLMSTLESKVLPIAMEEIPAISNVKSKLKFFETLTTPARSNSKLQALNVTPSGMASVKSRLQAFEVLHTVSSGNTRRSTPIKIFSDIPSLKSRMKAFQAFGAVVPDDVHLPKGAADFENKTLTVYSAIDNGMVVHPQSIITKRPTVSDAERYSRSIAGDQIVVGDYVTGARAPTGVGSYGNGQKADIDRMTTIKNGSVKSMVDFFHAK